jgi:hypothetical protein
VGPHDRDGGLHREEVTLPGPPASSRLRTPARCSGDPSARAPGIRTRTAPQRPSCPCPPLSASTRRCAESAPSAPPTTPAPSRLRRALAAVSTVQSGPRPLRRRLRLFACCRDERPFQLRPASRSCPRQGPPSSGHFVDLRQGTAKGSDVKRPLYHSTRPAVRSAISRFTSAAPPAEARAIAFAGVRAARVGVVEEAGFWATPVRCHLPLENRGQGSSRDDHLRRGIELPIVDVVRAATSHSRDVRCFEGPYRVKFFARSAIQRVLLDKL